MQVTEINCELAADILVRFLKEEAGDFGFNKAVLGISGGLDSAVSCALAVRAFGPKNVLGILMPYRTSSSESLTYANLLAKKFRIRTEKVEITDIADGLIKQSPKIDRLRMGNIMARSRMIVLYDRSARDNALVIGTSNKTEQLLGYGTIFGDMASAINPLGDLYKTQVFALARHLGVPKEIVARKPTPDLWEGQTSEGELGFLYSEVDKLLYYLVDRRYTEEELVEKGFKLDFIRRISYRVRSNQYKRRPPIIAKLSNRTINLDYRYLRDWGR